MYAGTNFENAVKRNWTVKEDFKLAEFVGIHGPKRWPFIAQLMKNRTARQCRERWNIKLNPSIRKGSWSPQEDKKIVELYCIHGSCWSEISKSLRGRVENDIRNRFNAIQRECTRKGYKTIQEAIDADVLDKIFVDKNEVSSSKKADDKSITEVIEFPQKRNFQNLMASPRCDSLIEKLARIDDIGNMKFPRQDIENYNIRTPAVDSYFPNEPIHPYHIMMMNNSSNSFSSGGFGVNNHGAFPTTNFNIGNDYVNALHYGEYEFNSRMSIFDQLSNPISSGSLSAQMTRHYDY